MTTITTTTKDIPGALDIIQKFTSVDLSPLKKNIAGIKFDLSGTITDGEEVLKIVITP